MSAYDKYQIDGQKLSLHPERVASWMDGYNIAPIYMEVSPSGACNHRCIFCALDFVGYEKRFLKAEKLIDCITQASCMGLESVMYAGEGEPLLHPEFELITAKCAPYVAQAITTNGVMLTKQMSESILRDIAWIKVSVNAGTAKAYQAMHRCNEGDWVKVWDNIADAVSLRDQNKWPCSIGTQMVLLKDNEKTAGLFAQWSQEVKADYAVIKPYSQHLASKSKVEPGITYDDFNRFDIPVIYRKNAFDRAHKSKDYRHCYALPFWAYLDAGGNVWGCSAHMGNQEWNYGNIYRQEFADIWNGPYRKEHVAYVKNEMDISECRINCRMDVCNEYLWRVMHPEGHDAFI